MATGRNTGDNGRGERNAKRSPEQRHQELAQARKSWDARVKSTLEEARRAARRSSA
jgi:hypothetical protein